MTFHDRVHSRRVAVLSQQLATRIPEGSTVLDVGCGDGLLDKLILSKRPDLKIRGLDCLSREKTHIPVEIFDGEILPAGDSSVDVVLLVDVLHHAERPLFLLHEATRVARRGVLIKDHLLEGAFAGPILFFMDWVGNRKHSVPIPGHYQTRRDWEKSFRLLGLSPTGWEDQLRLYAWPFTHAFDRKFHFIAFAEKKDQAPLLKKEALEQAAWEMAYERFETQDEEVRKFTQRLKWAGMRQWPKEAAITEIFCGRGNGLVALERQGYKNLTGVDLSPSLVALYRGKAKMTIGDCRKLPLADQSQDFVIVQGGLHHLISIEEDLETVLREVSRVLKQDGKFIAVEPWLTPFLKWVHRIAAVPVLRMFSKKLEALWQMVFYEQRTYFSWLEKKKQVSHLLYQCFAPAKVKIAWGKFSFVGRKLAGELR